MHNVRDELCLFGTDIVYDFLVSDCTHSEAKQVQSCVSTKYMVQLYQHQQECVATTPTFLNDMRILDFNTRSIAYTEKE